MKISTWSTAIVLVVALSACAGGGPEAGAPGSDKAKRPTATTILRIDGRGGNIAPLARAARYDVSAVKITVPGSLVVSEANLFYPQADIVWRGEPVGNRYAQVKSVVEEGFAEGVKNMDSGPKATLAITLERFHSLTEKARFSVGGVHDVVFLLTVRDQGTGQVLEGPRRVEVAILASGGDKAIAEDAAGNTQRAVIVAGLAEAIRRDLASVPVGIKP